MQTIKLENILFLDIETIPAVYKYGDLDADTKELWDKKWAYNKDISGEQQYQKAGIYAEFAKVVCIGIGFYNEKKFRVKTIASANELDILKEFSELLNKHFNTQNHVLCAHNGKEFDFPYICRRMLVNGLKLPVQLEIAGKKPWEINHLDTMELWKFGDYKHYTSLHLLANVLNVPTSKTDINGADVQHVYYKEKNLQRIVDYCQRDVVVVANLLLRFKNFPLLKDENITIVI